MKFTVNFGESPVDCIFIPGQKQKHLAAWEGAQWFCWWTKLKSIWHVKNNNKSLPESIHKFTISIFRLHNRKGFFSLEYTEKRWKPEPLTYPGLLPGTQLYCKAKEALSQWRKKNKNQMLTKTTQNNAFKNYIFSAPVFCELNKTDAINLSP